MGFDADKRRQFKGQFFDVGIAEETAAALASGIARNGGNPVLGVNSTFMPRTFDQILQDICLNRTPVTIPFNKETSLS